MRPILPKSQILHRSRGYSDHNVAKCGAHGNLNAGVYDRVTADMVATRQGLRLCPRCYPAPATS